MTYRTSFGLFAALLLAGSSVVSIRAQEPKKVPKDSVRVSVPGCSKDYVFTAGPPTEDQPGGSAIREGTHLRMNAPKKLIAEIKGQEGSRIEITGLIKRGQDAGQGVAIGRGARVRGGVGGPAVGLGSGMGSPVAGQLMIDVEGWRHLPGDCPR
jgi:hypothetical protein